MSELSGIYAIWLRETIRFTRQKSRILTSIIQPLLWFVVFGSGFSLSVSLGQSSLTYMQFLFPGIIGMALLFNSIFSGISVIWDKQFGFFKEILVAPISRTSVFVGKVLGSSMGALAQGTIVLFMSFLASVSLTPYSFIASLVLMALIAFGFVSMGLVIGALLDNMEGFNLIQTFVLMPIFFLSGALFPIERLPSWLSVLTHFNPLTYGIDALRNVLIDTSAYPLYIDFTLVVLFDAIMIALGVWAFSRKK